MNKRAILNKYRKLYKACNGILRIKQAAVDADTVGRTVTDAAGKIYDKNRTWGGFSRDAGKFVYNLGRNTIGNTANDAFARQLNDDNYNKALKAIEDGTYEGYDPAVDEVQGYKLQSVDLNGNYTKAMADAEAKKKEEGAKTNQPQIVIQNQMPTQGNDGGGGGYAQPGYGAVPRQPSLADRMLDYNMQKYSTR